MKYEVMVERVARAIHHSSLWVSSEPWDSLADEHREICRDAARAAIEAMPKLMPDGA